MSKEVKQNHAKSDKITFGQNLVEAALLHVEFLHQVDRHPCLAAGVYLENALRRYEELWLPLVANHATKVLVAPLDIQWAWHCHILSPRAYKKDCVEKFGKILPHRLLMHDERKQHAANTEKLWKENYPTEPFYLTLPLGMEGDDKNVNVNYSKFESKLDYDIRSAALRQSSFYYNVSLPHYRDRYYLSISLLRYKKFLHLKSLYKDTFIVPCYDIDLMWHTHQLFPFAYCEDMTRILGYVLNHDDSTTDRSPGSFLTTSYHNTCKLWREAFGENYQLPGAMYRGTNTFGQMKDFIGNDDDLIYSDDKFSVSLACVHFTRNPVGKNVFMVLTFSQNDQVFLTLNGDQLSWMEQHTKNVTVVMTKKDKIAITIEKHTHHQKEMVHVEQLNFSDIFRGVVYKTCSNFQQEFHLDVDHVGECSMILEGRIRQYQEPVHLKISFGEFKVYAMPSDLDSDFEPEVPNSNGSNCLIASHTISDSLGNPWFKCHVIHSLHNHVTCAQLYQIGNGLVSVIRMIDSSHLPLPNMVTAGTRQEITLSPSNGERALLIKDNFGDSTILIGRWLNEKDNGLSGVTVRAYRIRDDNVGHFLFPGQMVHKLEMGDVYVDLTDGVQTLVGSSTDIPTNVMSLIAFGLLTVLVLPRPEGWHPGQPIQTNETKQFNLDQAKFLVACGLMIETPSNFHRNRK